MKNQKKQDITLSQYQDAMRELGWKPEFMGYWILDGYGVSVHAANAGIYLRDRVAYMTAEKARIIAANPKPLNP